MGVNSAKNAVHLTESIIHGFDAFASGGLTAGGAKANTKILAIGNRALRAFNCIAGTSNLQNIFIGHDAGATLNYPALVTPNIHQYNICIGGDTFIRPSCSNLQYNTLVGHRIMNTSLTTNAFIQYNSIFGANSCLLMTGSYNCSFGYNNFINSLSVNSIRNIFLGTNVCNGVAGLSNNIINCTFIGDSTDVNASTSYTNSTCLGYGSKIYASNSIYLGTISEISYPMGGLTIPVSTNLTLLGNIKSDNVTITPIQLSFLNQVTANKIPSSVISNIDDYLTTSNASTIYQTISDMSNYLTTATASSTYQTISDMPNYLTTATASSTYQTISNMSSYLTTAAASSTYQTISNMSNYVSSALDQSIGGLKTFTGQIKYLNQIQGVSPDGTITQGGDIPFSGSYYHTTYSIRNGSSPFSVHLPEPSISTLGMVFNFRRCNGSILSVAISFISKTSINTNTYPLNSVTAGTIVMSGGVVSIKITCMYDGATQYGWYATN
jgi:hypothetical protein